MNILDTVEYARGQATAYVWGRQDAGESVKDTGYSVEFGEAYAERKRKYETPNNGVGMMPNIQAAFEEWRDTGTIA